MSEVIRRATLDDVDFVAELELSLFPDHHVNEYAVKQVIEAGMVQVFDQMGYICTSWGPELIDILRIAVHPDHQGKGIGRELMMAVLKNAWAPIVLMVKEDNLRAQALYKKLGFRFAGIAPQDQALAMFRPQV
jgi:ribosomal protein S18 acetylase RimI-like enzyme